MYLEKRSFELTLPEALAMVAGHGREYRRQVLRNRVAQLSALACEIESEVDLWNTLDGRIPRSIISGITLEICNLEQYTSRRAEDIPPEWTVLSFQECIEELYPSRRYLERPARGVGLEKYHDFLLLYGRAPDAIGKPRLWFDVDRETGWAGIYRVGEAGLSVTDSGTLFHCPWVQIKPKE